MRAEYSPQTPTSPCGTATSYLVTDHLGSTRMLTDIGGSNGTASNTVHRYDFLPFGGELLANVNGRTAQLGYSSTLDTMNPRFTGQMRDPETYDANGQTALDWFNVRHMSGAQGRFQSPDPGNAGADLANPQTWNGYAYVGNNPLSYTDPTGELAWAALPALCGPAAPYCAAALGAVAVILGIDAGGPESHPLPTQPAGQGVTNNGNFGLSVSPYGSATGSASNGISFSDVSEYIAAAGDNLTSIPFTKFSVTVWARSNTPGGDTTNTCSDSYRAGRWLGTGLTVALGAASGLEAAGTAGKGVEFSHWIPARFGGPRSIFNGNFVTAARHYLHDPFRFPPGWRSLGPKFNPVVQQLDRIPNLFKGTAAGATLGALNQASSSGCGAN